MPFRLIVHLPDGPKRFPLAVGEHVLGSDAGCDLRVRHMTVSRRHARLRVTEDGLWIEDLGSSNGTSRESRPLAGEERLDVPCRLAFGTVRAEVEPMAAGDMVSAVGVSAVGVSAAGASAVGAPASRDSSAGSPDRLEASASDGAGRTLSGSALEELTLRRLPDLVADLASGPSAEAAAQKVGAALFHSLPCWILEISRRTEDGEAVWFSARAETAPAAGSGEVEAESGEVRIRAGFVGEALADQLAPLVRVGLHLVVWAARAGRAEREPAPKRADGAPSAVAPPLPEPATVDPRLRALYAQASRVARSEIGVLIVGESGTGKELMARYVHRASERADAPFVALNCAALPRDLLEVELFGIERAVATGVDARPGKFELAHGGTLFLDEIGDMALETQAKILRVLQEGELFRLGGQDPRPARPRILAATHRDVEAMIEEGAFRRDLYYRLAGWVVPLPALRERLMDLPNLAAHFLAEEAESLGRDLPGISVAAMGALTAYHWPGNIRELRHEIRRAALFLDSGELLDSTRLSAGLRGSGDEPSTSLKERLEHFERVEISRAVERAGGDVPRAAEALGVGRSTLYRRMKALGLEVP